MSKREYFHRTKHDHQKSISVDPSGDDGVRVVVRVRDWTWLQLILSPDDALSLSRDLRTIAEGLKELEGGDPYRGLGGRR